MTSPLGIFKRYYSLLAIFVAFLLLPFNVSADTYPPDWEGGTGAAVHHTPAPWPADSDWKYYSRFGEDINDPRTQDPSNGGTAPQNYVNIASSCTDKAEPSVYYYLHEGATPADDVIMFRWRVEQVANTYATGPKAGAYSTGDAWNSALWTVLFDIDGDGYRDIAAHLDGSSGAPGEDIDRIFGIYGNIPTQSIDYNDDPNIVLLGHNPTAFTDATTKEIYNFQSAVNPTTDWSAIIALPDNKKVWDYGTTRSSYNQNSPCIEYYIDYQIPMALIDASAQGGPKLKRDTPISMLFCTSNSLNNPFQKDCAINNTWTADPDKPGPFGDYVSFDKNESYTQPIVDDIGASGCNPTTLTAKVKDVIAIVNGEAVPSVKEVTFYYYRDVDGDGVANDSGEWIQIATPATRVNFTDWMVSWDSTGLLKGQYLIGVQAIDDPSLVDDDMNATANTNRTFSYLSQVQVDAMIASKPADENWLANPDITGVKSISLAVNVCGLAPTIDKYTLTGNLLAGEDINFTVDINNSTGFDLNVSSISDVLPNGFTYKALVSLEKNGTPVIATTSPTLGDSGTISWDIATQTLVDTEQIKLIFTATATTTSGSYTNTVLSDTSYGILLSDPVPIQIDGARISLSKTPSSYYVDPGESLIYTLDYANDSSVEVTNSTLVDTLPADVTCNTYSINGAAPVDCTALNPITMAIGTLSGFENGSVEMNVTVGTNYTTSSLLNSAILTVTAPDGSDVNKTAESTIAVNVPLPAFTLDKTTTTPFITPGDTITWTIAYTNYGTENSSSTFITDVLPEGFSYSSCTGGASCSELAGVVTWDIGTVALGASGSVTVTAVGGVLNETFLYPNPALNTATITWSKDSTGITATNEVGLSGKSCSDVLYFHSDLTADSIYPTGDGDTTIVAPASNITFTTAAFTEETAIANKNITIDFYLNTTANAQDVSISVYRVNGGGDTLITTQAMTVPKNISLNTNEILIPNGTADLSIGENLKFVFEVTSGGGAKDVIFYYDGNIIAESVFADSRAAICMASAPAKLTVAKTVDTPNIATTGLTTPIVYTLNYTNVGGATANNLVLTDTLPSNVTCNDYSIDGGVAASCPSPFDVNIASLASGASGTITINATVEVAASGLLTNTASLVSTETPIAVVDTADTIVGPVSILPPSLSITKSVDKTYLTAGETATYTLTVVNTGGSATNITVSDTIPQQAYFDYLAGSIAGSTDGAGVVVPSDAASPTLSWSIDSLAQGEVVTLTFKMSAASVAIPVGVTTLDNNATLFDADYCTDISVSGCTSNVVTVSLSGNPVLNIEITADAPTKLAGETITYTVDYNNTGSADADNTKIVIPAPNNTVVDPSSLPSGATFDGTNNQIIFDLGILVSGDSGTFEFNAIIDGIMPEGTTIITAESTISASNALSDVDTADVTVTAGIDLIVNISGPTSAAFPSGTIDQDVSADTTIIVDDASQFIVRQVIQIGSIYTTIDSISGNVLTVADPVTANQGDSIIGSVTYSVVYQNHGDADATDTNLTVLLPAGIEYYDSISNADLAPAVGSDGNITWYIGTVIPDESGSYQVIAFPSATGSYTLTTKVVSNDLLDNIENNNTDEITTVFGGLKVFKSTSTPTVVQPVADGATENVNYTITITNTLSTDVADVNVTDTLAAGFEYSSTTSITGSITVVTIDNTFASQPQWTGITVPANGTVIIEFVAQITNTVGAATYQNAVYTITNEANTSVTQYDELSHPDEDVTVLNPTDALIEGYIFEDKNGNDVFDSGDIPYVNIEVTITDDSNPAFYYTAFTDGSGYFSRVVAEGNWTISHDTTNISLSLASGFTNPTLVVVPAGGSVLDLNPYVDFVSVPSFTVEKSTASTPTAAGDTLTYTFDVNNTGNVTLTDIILTDAKCAAAPILTSGDTDGDTELDVGETHVYSCTSIAVTQTEMDAGEVFNEVSVVATPPSGTPTPPVDDNLTTPVLPGSLVPSISLEKTGIFEDENNDGYADIGETISYEFNVTNIGNVTLYDINITDDNAVIAGGPIASMIPGESDVLTFTGIHTITWTDIINGVVINQAIVTAQDQHGNDVNDTSDDPENPVDDDIGGDGEPDDETSTGLPIKPPSSTDDTADGITGQDVIINIVSNDNGGTFALDVTTVSLIVPAGATGTDTDNDGDIDLVVVPGEGTWTVDDTTGRVTFSPESEFTGDPTPIQYTIEDMQGNLTNSEISINYPPVANDDSNTSLEEGETAILDVLANDQNTSSPLDPESVSLVDPGNGIDIIIIDGDIISLTVPDEGIWSVDEITGVVTFVPDTLLVGDPTIVNYTMRETNGDQSNEATMTVSYKQLILTLSAFCENDVPYISYDIQLVGLDPAGRTATMTWTSVDGTQTQVESGLALNNTHHLWAGAQVDGSGNGIVWPGWNELSDGSWEIIYSDWRRWNPDQSDATLTVTLSVNPTSSVTVQYPPATAVCSGNPPQDAPSVTVVAGGTGLPIATDNLNVAITSYSPTVINVLSNGDSFGVNGAGTVEILFTQPVHGTVALDDGGTPNDPTDDVLLYAPKADVNNITDSFTYTITDALGNTSTATVTLNVNCASSQTSDSGDALGTFSIMLMMFLTLMSGLYFVRKEERGEA